DVRFMIATMYMISATIHTTHGRKRGGVSVAVPSLLYSRLSRDASTDRDLADAPLHRRECKIRSPHRVHRSSRGQGCTPCTPSGDRRCGSLGSCTCECVLSDPWCGSGSIGVHSPLPRLLPAGVREASLEARACPPHGFAAGSSRSAS